MIEQLIIIDGSTVESRLFKDNACLQLNSKQTNEPLQELLYLIKIFCNF